MMDLPQFLTYNSIWVSILFVTSGGIIGGIAGASVMLLFSFVIVPASLRLNFSLAVFLYIFFSLGIITMFAYSWLVGLAVSMVGAICYVAAEAASAPPANDARAFGIWQRRQSRRRRPILVCLGDSLTHGTCSSSITPEIPTKLCSKLGMELPKYGSFFSDPLWVVNCGQNMITSKVIREERLNTALGCYPDYILLWIGCNDIHAVANPAFGKYITNVNKLGSTPTMQSYAAEVSGILDFLEQSSPNVKIGLCTLAPLGEDLKSAPNQLIREANEIQMNQNSISKYNRRFSKLYQLLCVFLPNERLVVNLNIYI